MQINDYAYIAIGTKVTMEQISENIQEEQQHYADEGQMKAKSKSRSTDQHKMMLYATSNSKEIDNIIQNADAKTQHEILGFVTVENKLNPDRKIYYTNRYPTSTTWSPAENYIHKTRTNIFEDD